MIIEPGIGENEREHQPALPFCIVRPVAVFQLVDASSDCDKSSEKWLSRGGFSSIMGDDIVNLVSKKGGNTEPLFPAGARAKRTWTGTNLM